MSRKKSVQYITVQGARQNNLKNVNVRLPHNRLIVISGVSGSGKSSLAFDTLFAEGQRRYIETFSPYARQFFDRMDKPQVDRIEGIPPAIAIEQRNAVKSTRSTVGTMTELCDHMKNLWPHLARLICPQCGESVQPDTPKRIWETIRASQSSQGAGAVLIAFELPLSDKLSLSETTDLIRKQGYSRFVHERRACRLEQAESVFGKNPPKSIEIVQDRIASLGSPNRARFMEACEQAYHFGKGKLSVLRLNEEETAEWSRPFSKGSHCAACDREFREASPALFSFNHPLGACPECRGFGRIITIDYDKALPDPSLSIEQGVVKPWQTGHGLESQRDLLRMARKQKVPVKIPFNELTEDQRRWVIDGDPDYGKDARRQWPHAWYGVKGYFRWLESKSYKMHVRVLLSRYRSYVPCPQCRGDRFQPETLNYRLQWPSKEAIKDLSLAGFYRLTVAEARSFIDAIARDRPRTKRDPLEISLSEVESRLNYLEEAGLGYLTLDRPTRSLSGGETERVNLTTCIGSQLVGTLFILDEPSVGLHARDTDRLIRILKRLRDAGNTVVVVEHEERILKAADYIVDLGPGHGGQGGQVVFQGDSAKLINARHSLTGQYLYGEKSIPPRGRRGGDRWESSEASADLLHDRPGPLAVSSAPRLALIEVHCHNLKGIDVEIPLGQLVCVSGVSGSGKTSLVKGVLFPALQDALDRKGAPLLTETGENLEAEPDDSRTAGPCRISGHESLGQVLFVDQSTLGKTPRSNPAVYIGAFDEIRKFFAWTSDAKSEGLQAGAFSFNSKIGQCERCGGLGFEKIEMQFLSDVFIRCPDCDGKRYRPHILKVKARPPDQIDAKGGRNIADLLDGSVEETIDFLARFQEQTPHARKAIERLRWLTEVGLGYLKTGQPINTLSGGESQRLKMVRYLADFAAKRQEGQKPALFLFDEPTTGLHFDDVRVLLEAFQRIIGKGHSIVVIEHNLEVLKSADWILDLGPEAGEAGGNLVAAGPPERLAQHPDSHTGKALKEAGVGADARY